jgi:nicotinate-nucleotide pyrophosphorylase (carboxylating)
MFNYIDINLEEAKPIIKLALEEDIKSGDITTNAIVIDNKIATMTFLFKEDGVIAGIPLLKYVMNFFNCRYEIENLANEGDYLLNGKVAVKIEAPVGVLLQAERTMLNFIQRMSGIATKTYKFVQILKPYSTKILDTRKTVPGNRLLDKYSVRMGGGCNHRFGLFDMVMIKDNHIKAAGSISEAVKAVRNLYGDKYKIEVETGNLIEVDEALANKADIIMLDNMQIEVIKESVLLINKKAITEVSGNITEEKLIMLGEIGIDYISSGALTHSVKALDISGKINIGD